MARQHEIPMTGYTPHLQRWFDWMEGDHSPEGLSGQLADNVVFRSPVVHTPQEGKMITLAYLTAAGQTLGGDTFRYTRAFDCGDKAVLEFECEMDGIHVNGVDMIEWNEDGKIRDFKVMVRPQQAVEAVREMMFAAIQQIQGTT